jgi:hypothetical protein
MCAIGNQAKALGREVVFIIKWIPRTTPVETIAKPRVTDANNMWDTLREGKRACLRAIKIKNSRGDEVLAARRVYRLTERTIDKREQHMLFAMYVLEVLNTTLPEASFTPEQIIALYADHGTHEKFHSEFKTDMDLTRLPSSKFNTIYLDFTLAAVAMNVLRLVGKHRLFGADAPVRHRVQRRRRCTVIQELMFKAARMVHHASQWVLGWGANDSAFVVFERHWPSSIQPEALTVSDSDAKTTRGSLNGCAPRLWRDQTQLTKPSCVQKNAVLLAVKVISRNSDYERESKLGHQEGN